MKSPLVRRAILAGLTVYVVLTALISPFLTTYGADLLNKQFRLVDQQGPLILLASVAVYLVVVPVGVFLLWRSLPSATPRSAGLLDAERLGRFRRQLLERLHRRQADIRSRSLAVAHSLDLRMEYKSEAVNPPTAVMSGPSRYDVLPEEAPPALRDQRSGQLPPGVTLADVFAEVAQGPVGGLLILGDPGAGKTTALLSLQEALIRDAQQDAHLPIPVVFPLTAWTRGQLPRGQLPLDDWLLAMLKEAGHGEEFARTLVEDERVLPLLDGLDEIPSSEQREACVEAINSFLLSRKRSTPHVVVTSREREYQALSGRLRFQRAVKLLPLTEEQIDDSLEARDQRSQGLQLALAGDRALKELAATPLFLNIMVLTYPGKSAPRWVTSDTLDERRDQLFDDYTDRMVKRQHAAPRYRWDHMRRWLAWLAGALPHQLDGTLRLERLQPEWLPEGAPRWEYALADRLGGGLLFGSLAALLVGLLELVRSGSQGGVFGALVFGITVAFLAGFMGGRRRPLAPAAAGAGAWRLGPSAVLGWLGVSLAGGVGIGLAARAAGLTGGTESGGTEDWLLFGLFAGLAAGPVGGLVGGVAGGPGVGARWIAPVGPLGWSTPRALLSALVGLGGGLLNVLNVLLYMALLRGQFDSTVFVVVIWFGSLTALSSGLLVGLGGGLVPEEGRDTGVAGGSWPGLEQSLRSAVKAGLIVGLGGGLILGSLTNALGGVPVYHPVAWLLPGMLWGLAGGLAFGGYACLSHFALRLVLWARGDMPAPWATAGFLEYATACTFLVKTDGGYRFLHPLLRAYFTVPSAAAPDQVQYAPDERATRLAARRKVLERVQGSNVRQQSAVWIGDAAPLSILMENTPGDVVRGGTASPELARAPRPSTQIVDVFAEHQGQLLILGDPGAGKTTLMLTLAMQLIERARNDDASPIPVPCDLASWSVRRLPVAEWLVDELATPDRDVPRQTVRAWIAGGRILPLLDGLDQVPLTHRSGCVQAINDFRAQTGAELIVTCRTAEYQELAPTRLALRGAVTLQQLDRSHVEGYLAAAEVRFRGLLATLRADEELWELAKSPLLLGIMAQVYQDRPAISDSADVAAEGPHARLLDAYLVRMFEHQDERWRPRPDDARRWMRWLAHALTEQSSKGQNEVRTPDNRLSGGPEPALDVERLQPEWLPECAPRWSRWWYALADRVGCGLLCGLLVGLTASIGVGMVAGRADGPRLSTLFSMDAALVWGLQAGVIAGLAATLLGGLLGGKVTASPTSPWSDRRMLSGAALGWMTTALGTALSLSLVSGRGLVDAEFLPWGLVLGLAGGLVGWLAGGPDTRPRHIARVEFITWSLGRALSSARAGLMCGLVVGTLTGLLIAVGPVMRVSVDEPGIGLLVWLAVGLLSGVATGAGGALIFGLAGGRSGDNARIRTNVGVGVRQSAAAAIRTGLVVWLVTGVILGAVTGLALGQAGGPILVVSLGVVALFGGGSVFGLAGGLAFGGYACLSHFALRLVLWARGDMPAPWEIGRFLEYAAARNLMAKVDNGYQFLHPILRKSLACEWLSSAAPRRDSQVRKDTLSAEKTTA